MPYPLLPEAHRYLAGGVGMVEILLLGIVIGLWLGYRTGYSAAVRKSGLSNVRGGLRRIRTGRF